MKRSSAVRHLSEMAEQATDLLRLRDTEVGWPLQAMWVGGDLLTGTTDVDTAGVVLMLDLPPKELPWLAVHPAAERVSDQLGIGKRPVTWFYRPRLWPAWNPTYRRVTRIWAAPTGAVPAALRALDEGTVADHAIVKPSVRELREQSQVELEVSRRHLHAILDGYWDRREGHPGFGTRQDRLWRAAQGVRELEGLIVGPDEAVITEITSRRRREDARLLE